MRMSFIQPAPPATVLRADAFDHNVGRQVPITMGPASGEDGAFLLMCTIVAVEVAPDGLSVTVTVETGDLTA